MRILRKALTQIGVTEIVGKEHNQNIVDYFHYIGHKWVANDETAWCSAFVNWAAKKCNLEHTGKLNARSWLDVGKPVAVPRLGDIVVFWRDSPSSWKGHVGIFIAFSGHGKKYIHVLGGNQSNKVCVAKYDSSKVLGFRRLKRINTSR